MDFSFAIDTKQLMSIYTESYLDPLRLSKHQLVLPDDNYKEVLDEDDCLEGDINLPLFCVPKTDRLLHLSATDDDGRNVTLFSLPVGGSIAVAATRGALLVEEGEYIEPDDPLSILLMQIFTEEGLPLNDAGRPINPEQTGCLEAIVNHCKNHLCALAKELDGIPDNSESIDALIGKLSQWVENQLFFVIS